MRWTTPRIRLKGVWVAPLVAATAISMGDVLPATASLPQHSVEQERGAQYPSSGSTSFEPPILLAKGPIMLKRKERAGRPLGQVRILTPGDVQGFSGTGSPDLTPTPSEDSLPAGGAPVAGGAPEEPVVYHFEFIPPAGAETMPTNGPPPQFP